MGVSGFPIKASDIGKRDFSQPWLVETLDIINIEDAGGGTLEITTSTPHGLGVTDIIGIFSPQDFGSSYNILTSVTIINSPTVITAPGIFTSNVTALLSEIDSPVFVKWCTDTPENFLRQIHVQINTDSALPIQVTLDGGLTFSSINNNVDIDGLTTFTMFVTRETLLNFQFGGADTQKSIAITITSM